MSVTLDLSRASSPALKTPVNLSGLTREAEAEWLAILAGRGEAELHLARGQRAQAQASLQAAEAEAARAAVAAHTATNA